MPRPQRDKDFPIFSSSGSATKKKTAQQAASRIPSEDKDGDANTSELTLTEQATMEQILAEVKSVASRVNDMDESVGARLDVIDGTHRSIHHLGGELFISSLRPSDGPGKAHGGG